MKNNIYALDFDGVICDSAIETAITGWKAAQQYWSDMPAQCPNIIIDQFRIVRPALETGFEAILIVRALFEGNTAQQLLDDFTASITEIKTNNQLTDNQLKQSFSQVRDHWIEQDLQSWIAMNPLFDGIASWLKQLNQQQTYIITTKQERFVSQIFSSNGIDFNNEHIFGLDRNMSKQAVLKSLLKQHSASEIVFIEDRLPTLLNVINDNELKTIKLKLADWGYNTLADKEFTKKNEQIEIISLNDIQLL